MKKILSYTATFIGIYFSITVLIYFAARLLRTGDGEAKNYTVSELAEGNSSEIEDILERDGEYRVNFRSILAGYNRTESQKDVNATNSTVIYHSTPGITFDTGTTFSEDYSTSGDYYYSANNYSYSFKESLCGNLADFALLAYDQGYKGVDCSLMANVLILKWMQEYPYAPSIGKITAKFAETMCILGFLDRLRGEYRGFSIRQKVYSRCYLY